MSPSIVGPQEGKADLVLEVRNIGQDSVLLFSGAFGAEGDRGTAWWEVNRTLHQWMTLPPGACVEIRIDGTVGAEGYRLECPNRDCWILPPGRHWIRGAYSWHELGPPRLSSIWNGDLRTARFELEVVSR